MLIITLLINFLLVIGESRRQYRASGGRAAGVGKVTRTFGKGVAALIKDIKQGNWGQQEYPQYDQRKGNRFIDQRKYNDSIGTDTLFYVIVIIVTLLIVAAILYCIIKVMPLSKERNIAEDMRKRQQERFKHYQAVKMVAQTGIHPDKAFGRLQKIKYKDK